MSEKYLFRTMQKLLLFRDAKLKQVRLSLKKNWKRRLQCKIRFNILIYQLLNILTSFILEIPYEKLYCSP